MGSRKYEHALELSKSYGWGYGNTPTIVVTSRILPADRQNIDGTPFFDHIEQEQALHLKDVIAYKNGMVELCYEIRKE